MKNLKLFSKKALLLFLVFTFAIITSAYTIKINPISGNGPINTNHQNMSFDGTYTWEVNPDLKTSNTDYIKYADIRTNYVIPIQNNTETVTNLETHVNGKFIRFDTANELYNFSRDVSFIQQFTTFDPLQELYVLNSTIDQTLVTALLSFDYVLGQDIDYSEMKSKAFVPIGYNFEFETVNYVNEFTGTFNGQGFEIKSLYLAGYDQMVITDTTGEPIDRPISSYYAMFTGNDGGEIKNFGLRNPNLELLQPNESLIKLANIVGENNGILDHVYVIDTREDVTLAGIRYRVGNAPKIFSAAGIVHTNNDFLSNVYYASKLVVNGNYINKFDLEPIVFTNNNLANTSNTVYDSQRYLLSVSVGSSTFTVNTPSNGIGETTAALKSPSSSLNAGNYYFYPSDGYPILKGFEYDGTHYEISSASDLVFFPEILKYQSILNNASFVNSKYRLTNDIDMGVLAPGSYKTPSRTFNGEFIGTNSGGQDQSDHYYIYNLSLTNYLVANSKIYAGLFSILGSGSLVKDLNFTNSSISISNTQSIFTYDVHVGSIAGEMIAGTIEDVYTDVSINLGTNAIGALRVGGIVGKASGVIRRVSNNGHLNINKHNYQPSQAVDGRHYVGGVVGLTTSAKMVLSEVVNRGDISSFNSDSTIGLLSGTGLKIYTGGVVGYVKNTILTKHEFFELSNSGNITLYSLNNPSNGTGRQYMGGVIGLIEGVAPVLEVNNEIRFASFYNEGNIIYDFDPASIQVNASGIAVTNISEVFELAMLKNYGTFNYDISGASETDFNYSAIIYDIGSQDFTLTRIYNYGNQIYNSPVYSSSYGIVSSLNNNNILLRYSANYGHVFFMNNNGNTQITLNKNLKVYAITGENNINYQNVHNYGDINVINVNTQQYDLYIAGFSTQLSSNRFIKSSLNDGSINFANISGSISGGDKPLIFVGGFVNTNLSGDLQNFALGTTQPIATKGILNSMNNGDISTAYNASAYPFLNSSYTAYDVDGLNNSFVGGLVTLNKGSIQDSANLGDIAVSNSNTSGSTTFGPSTSQSYVGGLIEDYSTGISAGGVAALVLSQNSRIYDSSNRGAVLVKTNRFSRAGGVLGVSLYQEATSGGITSTMGLEDNIQFSVLSNGLNFGDVSALTNFIDTYSTTIQQRNLTLVVGNNGGDIGGTYREVPLSYEDTEGSGQRLPVYASAGGVIGYGLSIMRNMLNHGTISSTDVAGGVVGATFVLGGANNPETIVNISTAVNYGEIKSILATSVSTIPSNNFTVSKVAEKYMADGNSFIFPTGYNRQGPRAKRGFGGIFGRLQRGNLGIMTPDGGGAFDFIVNANPNIDLIGRVDQVGDFSNTVTAYRFNSAIYYSAKENDTTQAVFTGFIYYTGTDTVTNVVFVGSRRTGFWFWEQNYFDFEITVTSVVEDVFHQQGITSTPDPNLDPAIATSFINTVNNGTDRNNPGSDYTVGQVLTSELKYGGAIEVPWITEDPNDPNINNSAEEYMYDASFEMRTNTNLTEYIYYSEAPLLADRFQAGGTNPRPNGMYVLSTSAGQTFGSVLPRNIDRNKIEIIDEDLGLSLNSDYLGIDNYRLSLTTNIIDSYNGLRQTAFSDQANLIDDPEQIFKIEEVNGSQNTLTAVLIDYSTKIITFGISMEAFDPLQTSASFNIINALTSSNALIAIRESETPLSTNNLQNALNLEKYQDIASASNTKAILDVSLPSQSITTSVTEELGWFSIYSEAFYMDPENGTYEFDNSDYYNDYKIDIIFLPNFSQAGGTVGVESVSFNGGANQNVAVSSNIDLRSNGNVNYDGSIELNFIDNTNTMAPGHDFKDNFNLFFNDGTPVDSMYYDVSSVSVNNNSEYSITFDLSEEIRSGDYYFEYSYFPASVTYRIDFDKAPSPNNNIFDFTYNTENGSLPPTFTNDFDSFIDLNENLAIDGTNNHITLNPNPISYLSQTYDIGYMSNGSLEISLFAQVTSAIKTGERYEFGYKVHELEYIIRSESGVNSTYTHEIYERQIEIISVEKDSNVVSVEDVFALRDATSTLFTIDLGLQKPIVSMVGGNPVYFYGDPNTVMDIAIVDALGTEITGVDGITYFYDQYLNIQMSIETDPGDYYFRIRYLRSPDPDFIEIKTESGNNLKITKNQGASPYLTDIRFSNLANETSYPNIDVTDASGNILPGYDPQAYFNGFDYDGADVANEQYFRIDGQVANIPLDAYSPIFDNFLPTGATLEKREWDNVNQVWVWTTDLVADFTKDPQTGLEPSPNDPPVRIRYRVTSEDGLNQVFYDINVTDVIYNLTFIFDIYYCENGISGGCVLAKDSVEFNEKLLIINVQNILTDGQKLVVGSDPAGYPSYSQVNGLDTKTVQLFYTNSPNYNYKFARNKSFFYNLSIELPLDQYLNDIYDYEIELDLGSEEYYLNDANTYVPGLQGKYFYIQDSVNLRTRRFNIYIYPETSPSTDKPFGLFDFFRSWRQ